MAYEYVYCTRCGEKVRDKSQYITKKFFKSKSPLNARTGFLQNCVSCVHKQYEKFYNTHKNHKYCVFLMCATFDYPYVELIAESAVKQHVEKERGINPFGVYIGQLWKTLIKQKNNAVQFCEWKIEYEEKVVYNGIEITDDLIFKWGDRDLKDYEFLQKKYDKICETTKVETEEIVTLVEEICIKHLELRKLRDGAVIPDGKIYKDTLDALQALMKTAGLDSRSKREMDSLDSLDTYGLRIKEIEENEPAQFFKDKKLYKDYDKIVELFIKFILRPLKNMLTGSRDFDVSGDFDREDFEDIENGKL